MLTRRGLIGTLLAAPAIIRTPGLLMPVKPVDGVWRPHEAPSLDEIKAALLRSLRKQDAWQRASLAQWARDYNFTQAAPDPRWRTSLA